MNELKKENEKLKKQLIIARGTMTVEFARKMFVAIGYGSGRVVGQDRIQQFIKENTDDGTHSFVSKEEVEKLKGKVINIFDRLLRKYGVDDD